MCYDARMKTITRSQKLSEEMKMLITQAVRDTLSDPDFGRELTEKARKRLNQARTSRGKTIPFSEIKKKYLELWSDGL